MKALALALVIALSVTASAGSPTLVAHDAGAYSIALPKGWTVVDNAAQGMVVAQQDPKQKDAAQLLVIVSAHAQGTDDQLLDAIMKNGLADAKVQRRDALPNAGGKLLIADGTVAGIAARLGAIAVVSGGAAVVVVLVAKTHEFDALGGTNTLVAVLSSLKATKAATPPTPAAPSTGTSEVMQPQYDSYKSLIVPFPRRPLTAADMAGEWKVDAHATRTYASASTGNYAGYSATLVSETYVVDGGGNMTFKASSTHVSNVDGTFQHNEAGAGTFTIDTNRTITITRKGAATAYYVVRGWFVGAEITIMRANGPWWKLSDISDDIRSDRRGANLDTYFVRKTR
ncbi:MAG TPA: hypothetical protein VMJ10_14200 [Kofleriaceae bacterium]|nr:hypothetical protein [Kofleriaceae bacterium]